MKSTLSQYANDFYRYGAEGKTLLAWHTLGNFFKEAEGTNPCTARMHLQYSLNSVISDGINDFSDGFIKEGKLKKINSNTAKLTGLLYIDPRFQALNKLIKEMYPKTYKKRLSILPNLLDSSVLGISSVTDNKKEKVSNYIVRKLMFWT